MKVAIVGSRSFTSYLKMVNALSDVDITEVVCGGAKGADTLGSYYANENNIPVKLFIPQWDRWGKQAGFIRNSQMLQYCDGVVAFWDGFSSGTGHMVDSARANGKLIKIVDF